MSWGSDFPSTRRLFIAKPNILFMKHYYIFHGLIPSSSVHSLGLCHNYKLLLCYVVVPLPPTNTSLFATHVMALCCPGLWLMATIQPEKFPWVGASWLTQRRNSLLLSIELTEQGGVWVIVRVSACMRGRERNSFFCACQLSACLSTFAVYEPSCVTKCVHVF